ncbi:Ankyrin-1 [Dactylellina cionopaga]|nr:Ankyrin-1 [Dactylellina cionopaga]
MLACLLFEKRYQGPPGLDGKQFQAGNLAALEADILKQISSLVCEILDFTWRTQHHVDPNWYKDSDLITAAGDPAQAAKSRTQKLLSKGKEKTKAAAEAISGTAKTVLSSIKEAFMNDLKNKYNDILNLYKVLTSASSVAFQDQVLQSVQDLIPKLGENIRNLEESLFERLEGVLTQEFDEIKSTIEGNHNKLLEVIISSNEEAKEERENVSGKLNLLLERSKDGEPTASDIFEKYKRCFRPSLTQKSYVEALFKKKEADGARMERSWFFQHEVYRKWRSPSEGSSKIVCLNGKKGHGKTMTLLSVLEDMDSLTKKKRDLTPWPKNILLRFFFRLGDNELQSSLRALESLLLQLLEKVTDMDKSIKPEDQEKAFQKVNALLEENGIHQMEEEMQLESRETRDTVPKAQTKSSEKICKLLSDITSKLSIRTYIILDALDECEDRKQMSFIGHLRDLAYADKSNVMVLFSVREEIRIEEELKENKLLVARTNLIKLFRSEAPRVEMVDIAVESTAAELHTYLKNKLTSLVARRLKGPSKSELESKADDLANRLKKRVNGDFSYANMVVANLQEPSKRSLEERIQTLPSNIEEIYGKSLELLTTEQRYLVLFALRWIGWAVSDVTAIEIAEHYKEIYWDKSPERGSDTSGSNSSMHLDPASNPEIREIISHLRIAGRDFFSFNADEDPITVHLTVREWIRNSSSPTLVLEGAEAQLTKSTRGRLVFEVHILPSSIPKVYHELAELFSEEESHLAITSDILRALTNKEFQYRYAPWDPPTDQIKGWTSIFRAAGQDHNIETRTAINSTTQDQASKRVRYEIKNWPDHMKVLQKFWSPEKNSDPKWVSFKALLADFVEPQNFYRYYVQRCTMADDPSDDSEWFPRYYKPQTVFFISLLLGLDFMTEQCCYSMFNRQPINQLGNLKPHAIFTTEKPKHFAETLYGFKSMLSFESAIHPLQLALYLSLPVREVDNYGFSVAHEDDDGPPVAEVADDGQKALLPYIKFFAQCSSTETISAGFKSMFAYDWDTSWSDQMALEIIEILCTSNGDTSRMKEISSLSLTTLMERMLETQGFEGRKPSMWMYIERVIEYGADVNFTNKHNGLTPLLYLALFMEMGSTRRSTLIIEEDDWGSPTLDINESATGDSIDDEKPKVEDDENSDNDEITGEQAAKSAVHLIKYFIERGADPNKFSQGREGEILLSRIQDPTERAEFLDNFFDINPVFVAARSRRLELMQVLIESGRVRMDQKDQSGASIMHHLFKKLKGDDSVSAQDEPTEVFDLILEADPGLVNAQDNNSRAPLSWAVTNGNVDGVAWLLKNGADVNDDDELGQTALHDLSRSPMSEEVETAILKLLHEFKADMTIRAKNGTTAFAQAIQVLGPNTIREFIKILSGGNSTQVDRSFLFSQDINGENILHCAASRKCRSPEDAEVVKELLELLTDDDRKLLISQKDLSQGLTPIHKAVMSYAFPLVPLFIAAGADITETSIHGKTLLHLFAECLPKFSEIPVGDAFFESCSEMAQLSGISNSKKHEQFLISLISSHHFGTRDRLMIILRNFSITRSWWDLLRLLLEHGVNLNSPDDNGWTAFHMFKVFGRPIDSWFPYDTEIPQEPTFKPSRLQNHLGAFGFSLSDDGLELRGIDRLNFFDKDYFERNIIDGMSMDYSDYDSGDYGQSGAYHGGVDWGETESKFMLTDYPIPIGPPRFYFEATTRRDKLSPHEHGLSIGLMPLPSEAPSSLNGLLWYAFNGKSSHKAKRRSRGYTFISDWDYGSRITVGIGFEYGSGKVFFTKNGKPVGKILQIGGVARWMPAVSVGDTAEHRMRVNLGSEKFLFNKWDAPIEAISAMIEATASN